jgi:Putative Actinobacterial Holin-X, holin superfamily III
MPKIDREQAALPQLIRRLADEGAHVAEAELALARAEAAVVIRGYVTGIAVGGFSLAMAVTTLTILAQAGVIALMPYVANPVFAYFAVGLLLAAMTIGLAVVAGNMISRKHRPIGLIFKWLAGDGVQK